MPEYNYGRESTIFSGGRHYQILQAHHLTPEIFAGKTILDAGSGYSDLAGDLFDIGVDCTVIGFDTNINSLAMSHRPDVRTHRVIADIGELYPLLSESVDITLATMSYPLWARNAERISTFFNEAARVTKVGGLLSITPTEVHAPILDLSEASINDWYERYQACQTGIASIALSEAWQVTSDIPELLQARKLS